MQVEPGSLLIVDKPFTIYGTTLSEYFTLVGGDYIIVIGELNRGWVGECNVITKYGSLHFNEMFLHNWYVSEVTL